MMEKSLDDICLEIYLGELVEFNEYNNFDKDTIYTRLEKLIKTAREVNSGIWAKGWNREQALMGAGYIPEIIETIADHEWAKDRGYNGC